MQSSREGQLGRFDDQKVQYTDARGRWMWIAYRAIETLEFKDQPLSPAGTVDSSAARCQPEVFCLRGCVGRGFHPGLRRLTMRLIMARRIIASLLSGKNS